MKKLLSILLTVAMLLSLSVCAFAEEEVEFADVVVADTNSIPEDVTLQVVVVDTQTEAVEEITDTTNGTIEGTIIIDSESNVGGVKVNGDKAGITSADVTIQVSGEAVIADPSVGSSGTETLGYQLNQTKNDKTDGVLIQGVGEGAEITFDGDSEGNHEEYEKGKNADSDCTSLKLGIQNYTDLTLDNVTIDGTDLSNWRGYYDEDGKVVQVFDEDYVNYVVSNNSGSLTVTNGASILAADGDVAIDLCIGGGGGYLDDVPQITIEENAGTIQGTIEVTANSNAKTTNEKGETVINTEEVKEAPSIDIAGGIFQNFAIIIEKAVDAAYGKFINVTGGTFSFDDNPTVSSNDCIVINTPGGLSAYIPSGSEIVAGEGGSYFVRAIVKETPTSAPTAVYIPVEYYAPVTAPNAEVEVDGETVTVALNDTVVSAQAAPVALADNAPAEVKVVVAHSALSGNVHKAVEMVQSFADGITVLDPDGTLIDAAQYEVAFDGFDTIQLKLSPELLELLGAGTHELTVVLGGFEFQFTIVIQ